jgi:predicted nucleic acid-binding protein
MTAPLVSLPSRRETGAACDSLVASLVATRGGQPRRRAADLAIAATANANGVPLLTYNTRDFKIIDDLVDVHAA